MPGSATLRFAGVLAALALLGACGVGAVKETSFVYGAMGPEGGTVQAGDVTLEVPAGALAGPTTIAILPETNPLPIQAPANDPCEYALLGPQWCCGPVGLVLLEDGRLLVGYDEALLPLGVAEDDLVLLLWDAAIPALVPAGAAAVHDLAANTFEVASYDVLGHLAVGYRTCPRPGIVFLGLNPLDLPGRINKAGEGERTADEPSGLWLVAADGSTVPAQLPTDTLLPQSFLPSPDGTRVLFEFIDFQSEVFGPVLYAVGVEDGVSVLLAGDDERIDGQPRTLGWMRDGQRVFFQESITPPAGARAIIADVTSFSTVPGDGSAGPSSLYEVGPFAYVDDVRQSPDGSLVLVAFWGQFENRLVDVFASSSGLPVSQGLIPYGGGNSSPRFLPDASGVYLVDSDREGVMRYDPDGSNPVVLFDPPPEHGFLKDFVLASNGDDYAYVALSFGVDAQKASEVAVPGFDALYLGSLSGGLREVVDLGVDSFYSELIFHPSGEHVLLDEYQMDVRMFAASDGTPAPALNVEEMDQVDISAVDGRLLLVVRPQRAIAQDRVADGAQVLAPGLYVADPDGQNQQQVLTPADLDIQEARWLRTVRRAPCMRGAACFR